jgi:hypothetical protein
LPAGASRWSTGHPPAVLMHVSKGVLMPTMFYWAWVSIRHADIVHLHRLSWMRPILP